MRGGEMENVREGMIETVRVRKRLAEVDGAWVIMMG